MLFQEFPAKHLNRQLKGEFMEERYRKIISNKIAPIVQSGHAVLFLGAGFSCTTKAINGNIVPTGLGLTERILKKCGYHEEDIKESDLQTAFTVGEDDIRDFYEYLRNTFIVNDIHDWQKIPFYYWWRRVYTLNIDNIIDVAVEKTSRSYNEMPKFTIFNYRDRLPVIQTPLEPPIVYLHGKIDKADDGFIFDRVSYADHSVKSGDWLYDAAQHLSYGNCIIVGSKLRETDLETELRKRRLWDQNEGFEIGSKENYIVLDKVNSIDARGYKKRGLIPIECTAEEFFEFLEGTVTKMSAGKLLKRISPHLKFEGGDDKSLSWFNQAFTHIPTAINASKPKKGIYSKFFSGDYPDWYYIANGIQAKFSYLNNLVNSLKSFYASSGSSNICLLKVSGPVGSGKTTLCRSICAELSKTIEAIYEYESYDGINIEYTWKTLQNTKGELLLYFDKSSEHFYAINELCKRFIDDKPDAKVVFIIEDREVYLQKNTHFLNYFEGETNIEFRVPHLTFVDSTILFTALTNVGMKSEKLMNLSFEDAASLICDTEAGYRGDLLATLCDISGQGSFESKLTDEINDIRNEDTREIYELISIVSASGLTIPISYLSEIFEIGTSALTEKINRELDGKIFYSDKNGTISTRHSIISEFHVKNCISNKSKEKLILKLMKCVSSKFSIQEIRLHPLPYRIYKKILHHYFMKDILFPNDNSYIEEIYSRCQTYFVEDGIFWLQYGKYLDNENRLPEAEHCFRKGLSIFDSFQLRHALGHVLLKQYCKHGCIDDEKYSEGVTFLLNEVNLRGDKDPYPYNTLCSCLLDVLSFKQSDDVLQLLKEISNRGLKFHKNDAFFTRTIQRGISQGHLGVG